LMKSAATPHQKITAGRARPRSDRRHGPGSRGGRNRHWAGPCRTRCRVQAMASRLRDPVITSGCCRAIFVPLLGSWLTGEGAGRFSSAVHRHEEERSISNSVVTPRAGQGTAKTTVRNGRCLKRLRMFLVGVLEQIGVQHIFGLIGDSLNPLADAISRSQIEWIGVRHEEGAALAAAGQAKLTGQLAVCAGTHRPRQHASGRWPL